MRRAAILLSTLLAATASAADAADEQIISLVSRSDGARVALAVVVTDRTGARRASAEPLVVDLMVGDALIGTLTVDAGSSVSSALRVASDLAGSEQLRGRMRIAGTEAHAGDLHPIPAKPVSVN